MNSGNEVSNPTMSTMTSPLATDRPGLLNVLQVLVRHARVLILVPLFFGILALAISAFLPPTFSAVTRFLPPQQQQSAAVSLLQSLGGLAGGAANGLKNPADQYVAFLKTNAILDLLIDKFALADRYGTEYRQETRDAVSKRTKVISGKEGIISIQFDDKDPEFAAQVANAYISELGQLLNRLAVTEAQQRRVFFEKQMESSKNNLVKAEQALGASGVGTSALNASLATALEAPARLRAQVTALEVKLASMRSYLTDTAPEFKQVLNELAATRSQLARAEREQPDKNVGQNDYIAKLREVKYQETLFELFSRQYEVAKIDESREGAVIQVIDVATPPELKSKPNRKLIATMAVLVSGGLIALYLLIADAIKRSRQNPVIDARVRNLQQEFRRAFALRRSGT